MISFEDVYLPYLNEYLAFRTMLKVSSPLDSLNHRCDCHLQPPSSNSRLTLHLCYSIQQQERTIPYKRV